MIDTCSYVLYMCEGPVDTVIHCMPDEWAGMMM